MWTDVWTRFSVDVSSNWCVFLHRFHWQNPLYEMNDHGIKIASVSCESGEWKMNIITGHSKFRIITVWINVIHCLEYTLQLDSFRVYFHVAVNCLSYVWCFYILISRSWIWMLGNVQGYSISLIHLRTEVLDTPSGLTTISIKNKSETAKLICWSHTAFRRNLSLTCQIFGSPTQRTYISGVQWKNLSTEWWAGETCAEI